MITFEQFFELMKFETENKYCLEIAFSVSGSEKYGFCWMGKRPESSCKDLYWFGLTEDGKEYHSFEEFSSAPVFDGKSVFQIWNDVVLLEINGCDPTEMIEMYLK